MLKLSKLRAAALTLLAVGTLGIGKAQAAVNKWDQCDEEALGLLIGACDVLTGGDWDLGIIWYTCDEDGHMDSAYGECYTF